MNIYISDFDKKRIRVEDNPNAKQDLDEDRSGSDPEGPGVEASLGRPQVADLRAKHQKDVL
ncbi:MAG: hypothetical protein ACP5N9_01230 [Candidatus Bilamarchaeum sp.]|jgi:hypothetical protein